MSYGYKNNQEKVDVVFDFETVPLPVTQEEIEEYLRELKMGNAKKPETVARKKAEAEQDAIQKCLDAKRFCVWGARVISAAFGVVSGQQVSQVESCFSDDETEIAAFAYNYLKEIGSYRLVGYNIKNFDLPHFARILSKANLRLAQRPGKWDIIDMCDYPFGRLKGATCKRVAAAYGITPKVRDMNGSHVEQAYANGDFEMIRKYNESDVHLEGELLGALTTIYSF